MTRVRLDIVAAARSTRRKTFRSKPGMTLIEIMIGVTVFATTAMAALSALLFSFKVSDADARSATAVALGRSILEQIATLDYTSLTNPTLPVDIPTSSVGSLNSGQWNDRTDDIYHTAGNQNDDLVISLRPEITRTVDTQGGDTTKVTVRFRWDQHSFLHDQTCEETLTIVRSSVSSF